MVEERKNVNFKEVEMMVEERENVNFKGVEVMVEEGEEEKIYVREN